MRKNGVNDQIYAFNWGSDTILEQEPQMISNGLGRTTCAYFLPGDTTIFYTLQHSLEIARALPCQNVEKAVLMFGQFMRI